MMMIGHHQNDNYQMIFQAIIRIKGKAIYHTGSISAQIIQIDNDICDKLNQDKDEDKGPDSPIDEREFIQSQALMGRWASRKNPENKEQASGNNDLMRLLGESASRSYSSIPKKNA